jgi:hypothetical protein
MDLIIRSLDSKDNKEEIFELFKKNNLIESKYATNIDIWNFQYNDNPLEKSWNSVLVNKDDGSILGHIGLIPQVIRAFSSDWGSASISNGAISSSVRNKLLPFNKSKVFAIIPLIDNCVKQAFNDKVDISFVYSSIHPMIWRTLKYSEIKVEQKTTIHSNIRHIYNAYYSFFVEKYKISSIRHLAVLYSLILIGISLVKNIPSKIFNISNLLKSRKLIVNEVDKFNSEFNIFFDCFYNDNSELITYKRNIDFLNWRFTGDHFQKYTFRVKNKIIGYIILEKNKDNLKGLNCKVLDFIVLDEYLHYTSLIFKRLNRVKKIQITFPHYLSCNYSNKLFKQCFKHGYNFTPNPLRGFKIKNKKPPVSSCLFYKINSISSLSTDQKDSFNLNNWFITPIFFTPTYNNEDL